MDEFSEAQTASASRYPLSSRSRITLPIADLAYRCGGVPAVQAAILAVHGVACAYVSPATEMAYVEYDPGTVGEHELNRAIASVASETARAGEQK